MASTAAFAVFAPTSNSESLFPFATNSFDEAFAIAAASSRPSFRLAATRSCGSMPWASRNLDAR
jgi:hypothetical protein